VHLVGFIVRKSVTHLYIQIQLRIRKWPFRGKAIHLGSRVVPNSYTYPNTG